MVVKYVACPRSIVKSGPWCIPAHWRCNAFYKFMSICQNVSHVTYKYKSCKTHGPRCAWMRTDLVKYLLWLKPRKYVIFVFVKCSKPLVLQMPQFKPFFIYCNPILYISLIWWEAHVCGCILIKSITFITQWIINHANGNLLLWFTTGRSLHGTPYYITGTKTITRYGHDQWSHCKGDG